MNKKNDALNRWKKKINHEHKFLDIGIWDYNFTKDEFYWSEKIYKIFGLNKKQVLTFNQVIDFIHPNNRDNYLITHNEALNKGKGYSINYRILRKDGKERIVSTTTDVLLDQNNQVVRMIGTTIDITNQSYFNQQVLQRAKEISDLFLKVGIWSMDTNSNNILFCSNGIESITGYASLDFQEKRIVWKSIVYQEDIINYFSSMKKLKLGEKVKHSYRIVHKNGEVKWVMEESIPSFDLKGNLIRIDRIVTDITEQKKSEDKMAYLAHHDFLTNLPNRRFFDKELNLLIKSSARSSSHERFAVMCLDMDGFKRVNDTFGHLTGDKLLIEISSRLKQCVSHHNLVARMGGDEFSVILRNISNIDYPISIAKKIISCLEEPFFIEGYELYITTSIGIAISNNKCNEMNHIFKKADNALYRAKEAGKNNYQIYTYTMEKEFFKLYTLERDLRKALKKNEFFIHFQPKVNTKTGQIHSGEALIRWRHHKNGIVSPKEFIPLAEENGIIFQLTDWTFRTVCEQINKWKQKNIPLVPISINISPKQFLKHDWAETFVQIMEDTGVDPFLIELEITESVLIRNEESFASSIKILKNLGVRISLDDFGIGYSSLIYLKKFQIDTIKIDQYFINNSLAGEAPLTKYIINLAHDLKMNVVAEGVETEEQLQYLRQYGCDQLQGYLFSQPVSAEQFIKLLEKVYLY